MKLLSQMTEEELKTLCKSFETSYCEGSTVTIKQSDFNNMWSSIDGYAKENKRLQEQLNEANEVIKKYMALGKWYDFYNEGPGMVADDMQKYLEKWVVK